jgi:hypothetical protein
VSWDGGRLREHRKRFGLTQVGLAEALTDLSRERDGALCRDPGERLVRAWERGEKRPGPYWQRLLCELYGAAPHRLGFRPLLPGEAAGERALDTSAGMTLDLAVVLDMPRTLDSTDLPGPMSPRRPEGFDQLVATLVHHGASSPPADALTDLPALTRAAAAAKRNFQTCRYALTMSELARLLCVLPPRGTSPDGDDALRAWAISAHVYHTAAGVLLKLGHDGLAYIAADRSMESAQRSQDPLVIGSSARVVAHAFLRSGHFREARMTATSVAAELDTLDRTRQRLSVFGSLLLRGAIAAARDGDRTGALELLDEADSAAKPFGKDHNYRWTAFGPTNVLAHRVNVAVTLGDAGTALEHARAIDPNRLATTERRVCLCVDAARALIQWDKYAQACQMLAAAEQLGPEELTSRPSVRAMVGEMARSAPRSAQPDVRALAARVGADR